MQPDEKRGRTEASGKYLREKGGGGEVPTLKENIRAGMAGRMQKQMEMMERPR